MVCPRKSVDVIRRAPDVMTGVQVAVVAVMGDVVKGSALRLLSAGARVRSLRSYPIQCLAAAMERRSSCDD